MEIMIIQDYKARENIGITFSEEKGFFVRIKWIFLSPKLLRVIQEL